MGPVIAILLLLTVLLAGCPQPPESVMERPVLAAGPDSAAEASLEGRLRQEVQWGRPLPPDSRFLAAAEEIESFFSGQAKLQCGAFWQENSSRWTVLCGDQELGTVPNRPEYSDYLGLLTGWAERNASSHPAGIDFEAPAPSLKQVDRGLAQMTPAGLISSLQSLDALWREGKRHPLLLQRAARGLVLLALQSGGLEEASDRVAARALALTVLAGGGLALQNVEAEEALLAHHLGYRRRAIAAASQLPPGHPVQLFLQGSLEELRQAAEKGSVSEAPLARFLYLRRLAEASLPKDWDRWAERHYSGLKTALPVLYSRPPGASPASDDASVWERTLDLVQVEAARAAGELNASLEKALPARPALEAQWKIGGLRAMLWRGGIPSIEQFESLLDRLDSLYVGPFLDSRVLAAHFRGFFYSALYSLAKQSLQERACNSVFNLGAPMAGDAQQGEWAESFQSWFQAQLEKSLSPQGMGPFDTLAMAPRGTDGLLSAFESLAAQLPYGDPVLAEAARHFADRLDSRPSRIPLQCGMHSILALKALAQGQRQEAVRWFAAMGQTGCSPDGASRLQLARWVAQARPESQAPHNGP